MILGKGGSDKYIHNWGGYGRGRAPPVTAKGSGGALIAPPVGSGQPLFCFCVYLATRNLFILHNAIYGSYCSAI